MGVERLQAEWPLRNVARYRRLLRCSSQLRFRPLARRRRGARARRGATPISRASGRPRVNTACRSSGPRSTARAQVLTDEEYTQRLQDVRVRDEQDLAPVDVLSGRVQGATAPIPHWREYNTTSRRTSLVIDPPDGRLPPRTPTARPIAGAAVRQPARRRAVRLVRRVWLGVRCIVHGGGFPDAMIPAVYNANMRIAQSPGYVAITYELIHDTRIIPIESRRRNVRRCRPKIRMYMGNARGRWDGTTLVVETTNLKAASRGSSPGLRLTERFTRTGRDAMAVPGDLHRSGDVDGAVDGRARHEGAAGQCRCVRVRVPRRQPRHELHAGSVAPARLRAPEVDDRPRHSNGSAATGSIPPYICPRSSDRRPRNAEKA